MDDAPPLRETAGTALITRADRISTLVSLPLADKVAALQAVATFAMIEVLLRFASLRQVVALLRIESILPGGRVVDGAVAPFDVELSQRQRRALRWVRSVARRWRFCEGACLREALVTSLVVRDHAPSLVIGVVSTDVFSAHAWVEVAGQPLMPPLTATPRSDASRAQMKNEHQ